MPFDHSFLSGGIDFCAFLNKSFYQHSLLYQSMLLGGVGCCMSNLFFYHPALLCHSIRLEKTTLPLFTPLGGDWFYISIYIHTFLSRIPSIILHASLIPNFRKCHSTIHFFLQGMISLYFSKVSSIIVHCPINPCFWEGVDVACQFLFFHPALLCYPILLEKTILPSCSPLIGDWFFYKYVYAYIIL